MVNRRQKAAETVAEAGQLRQAARQAVSGGAVTQGGILAALRRSPLVGAELDLTRLRETGRRQPDTGS
jgi:hypothetical protein